MQSFNTWQLKNIWKEKKGYVFNTSISVFQFVLQVYSIILNLALYLAWLQLGKLCSNLNPLLLSFYRQCITISKLNTAWLIVVNALHIFYWKVILRCMIYLYKEFHSLTLSGRNYLRRLVPKTPELILKLIRLFLFV